MALVKVNVGGTWQKTYGSETITVPCSCSSGCSTNCIGYCDSTCVNSCFSCSAFCTGGCFGCSGYQAYAYGDCMWNDGGFMRQCFPENLRNGTTTSTTSYNKTKLNVSGTWKVPQQIKLNVSSTWKTISK